MKQSETQPENLLQVAGILVNGDASLGDGSLYDEHIFQGQTGQIVRITLKSSAFDAYLLLLAPSGDVIGENDDDSNSTNSEILVQLSENGVYRILANAYDQTGRGPYQLTVDIASEAELQQANLRIEADRLFQQGLGQIRVNQYSQALTALQTALSLYRQLGDRQGEVDSLSNLGVAYYSLGDYDRAISLHEQSLAIERELDDHQGEASSLNNLGNAHERLGNYRQAIGFHEQSLAIEREFDDRLGEASSLNNLGSVYYRLGDYQRVIDFQEQSLAIFRELGDRRNEAVSLNNLGLNYDRVGDYDRAVDSYGQSLSIFRELNDFQGQANSLGNLGLVYYSLGDYDRAIDFHEQSLTIFRELSNRQGEANSLGNLGLTYANLGDYRRAIDFYRQSVTIFRELDERQGEATSLNDMAVILNASDQFTEAERLLRQSTEIYESLRADLTDAQLITIADAQAHAYTNLEIALIAQGEIAKALEITERGRAQAFALQLALRQGARSDESFVTYPDLTAIQRIAQEQNLTLVSYSLLLGEALHIWVVRPTGEIAFQSVDASQSTELANLIEDFRNSVSASGRGGGFELVEDARTDEQLRQLHQLLIDPIAQWLPIDPNQQVVIVPQGDLFLVPFAALADANGTYLIEKHTLTTAPSIQVLDLATNLAAQNTQPLFNDALVVGNPTMPDIPDIPLDSLPGAEFEAREIGELVGTTALIGNQATEARIKQTLPTAQLIHLATHGLLSYGDSPFAIPGAVALTPGNGEDGLLTADEILDMELQAQLAILSACDTGQGQITGDGVVGLSRSLITAGVPSVVVSLWSVPDAPTASLMTEFYRQLTQGQTKAQALRQAMLMTLENHPNPIDWAAFTLIGEAE
ncbi:MAG: CHAT domain-containing protein [Cyanobacteria bacterium J06635_15]